ncbi:hypothetical protein GQR58_028477 [Nymphon striatum]|nr:hypothetical protein GQR58_028477 [Nymphon striatum]
MLARIVLRHCECQFSPFDISRNRKRAAAKSPRRNAKSRDISAFIGDRKSADVVCDTSTVQGTNMAWKPSTQSGPIVCGHRGAAAVEAENTIASFQVAADRGATWVEFDVRPAGGSLVIHHDPDTADGVHVATSSRAELDSSIPLFAELAAAMPWPRPRS